MLHYLSNKRNHYSERGLEISFGGLNALNFFAQKSVSSNFQTPQSTAPFSGSGIRLTSELAIKELAVHIIVFFFFSTNLILSVWKSDATLVVVFDIIFASHSRS